MACSGITPVRARREERDPKTPSLWRVAQQSGKAAREKEVRRLDSLLARQPPGRANTWVKTITPAVLSHSGPMRSLNRA